ncbi:hypothetical protein PMAL9190_01315 [Photobacterium malacitanum]|uniref:Uncharacterized protein n=1 Tax=Photobacterium malacitanum TaxID=2204294 RepID=A0A1Y6MBD6_9GAMM|nr:hypothetical protein [Photobacterium malacitanum]SMY33856.1 hypothetical protein PMAL9190_01315 [Photobacterium malacitanum]
MATKFITLSMLGISLFFSSLANADVKVKTAHELEIFRFSYIHSITPFDLKQPTEALQTIANLYALTYVLKDLPLALETKFDTLSSDTQKDIAYKYCKAYSTPSNTQVPVSIMLSDILSRY